jgi:hypothetical protein
MAATTTTTTTTTIVGLVTHATHPPNDAVAIEDEDVDLIEEFGLRVGQFEGIGHVPRTRGSVGPPCSCHACRGAGGGSGGNPTDAVAERRRTRRRQRGEQEARGGGRKLHAYCFSDSGEDGFKLFLGPVRETLMGRNCGGWRTL